MQLLSCLLVTILVALLAIGPVVGPAPAATPELAASADIGVPLAFWDGPILGNRARMVQLACVGMAIAIFVLTRGHKQGK